MSRNVGAAAAAIAAAPARNPRCRWTTGDDCSETCWCISDGGGVFGIRPRRCCIPHVVSSPRAASHVRLALARSWTTSRLSALQVRVACLIYQPVPSPPPCCPPAPPSCLTSLRTLSITLPNVTSRTHAAPGRYARHATPTDMSKELSNQQISRRGPYLNSGSNDIGPTPDGFATSARARRTAQTRQRGSAEN